MAAKKKRKRPAKKSKRAAAKPKPKKTKARKAAAAPKHHAHHLPTALIHALRDCKHVGARNVFDRTPGDLHEFRALRWCQHCGAFYSGDKWHHPTLPHTLIRDLGAFRHHPR